MAKKKRTKIEREADLVVTADLYRRGWNMRQIAAELTKRRPYSLSHVQIKLDIDKIFRRWQKKQDVYISNFITAKLEEIREMKRELWSEYLRSKKPRKKIKEKRITVTQNDGNSAEHVRDYIDKELDLDAIFSDDVEDTTLEMKTLEDVDFVFTDLTDRQVDVEQLIEVEERLGNPRYLELIDKLIEKEAKLLGFYTSDNTTVNATIVTVNIPPPEDKSDFIPIKEIDNGE